MQKYFDKIKERLEEETYCPNCSMYCADANMCGFDEMRKQAIEIVNQVAEEYSNDFCEWHKVKNGNAYQCNTHAEIHDSRVLDWYVCPYCGKEIKIAPYQPKGE